MDEDVADEGEDKQGQGENQQTQTEGHYRPGTKSIPSNIPDTQTVQQAHTLPKPISSQEVRTRMANDWWKAKQEFEHAMSTLIFPGSLAAYLDTFPSDKVKAAADDLGRRRQQLDWLVHTLRLRVREQRDES